MLDSWSDGFGSLVGLCFFATGDLEDTSKGEVLFVFEGEFSPALLKGQCVGMEAVQSRVISLPVKS